METNDILISVITLIGTAVFVVALFQRLRLSPVLGYLTAGAAIGDHGFQIVTHEQTNLLGEFGVVFLLFAIGLELSFERLKAMRKYVFGLGTLQVVTTSVVIAGCVALITQNGSEALIIGGGLALSSTAIVMRVIEENKSQATQVGRVALSILLMQDFAVVPLLVTVPLLAGQGTDFSLLLSIGAAFLKAGIALLAIFTVGRLFLRPIFGLVHSENTESSELPITMTLLIVLSAAWGTEYFGLSLALGAFVAGVLVAETDFRIEAEESIYPFKSLLLGLFFMSVGMNIDAYEIYKQIFPILTLSLSLILVKSLIITAFCILFGFSKGTSFHSGILLSQGGEFAFILFDLAKRNEVLAKGTADILLLVITFTMALTPLLSVLGQKISEKLDGQLVKTPLQALERGSRDLINHVIIAGFGKVGKMVAKVLEAEEINYIAIDINNNLVSDEAASGFPVFKGDASRLDVLEAVGAPRALTVILAMNNEITIKKSLKTLSNHFENIDVIVRLKNLKKSKEFYEAGATTIIPEEYETGLQLGGAALRSIGVGEHEINRIKEQFRSGNYVIAKKERSLLESEENE